jgi:hypothetical protein
MIFDRAKRSGEICVFPHLAQRARQIWGTLDWWGFWIRTFKQIQGGKPQPMASRRRAMILDRVFMGLRPTQGNENRVEEGLLGNYT